MATTKLKGSLLELCTSTASLGNKIALHILEYLNKAKHPPQGFKDLGVELVGLGRLLVTARAGLVAAQKSRTQSLLDFQELSEFIRQTNTTLIALDQTVSKLLESTNKHGLGKIFRSMFSDTDTTRLKSSMVLCREILRSSIAVQGWTLVGDRVETAGSLGYTALAAVLGQPDPMAERRALSARQASIHSLSSPELHEAVLDAQIHPLTTIDGHLVASHKQGSFIASGLSVQETNSYGRRPSDIWSSKPSEATTPISTDARELHTADSVSAVSRMSSVVQRHKSVTDDCSNISEIPKQPVRISADPSTVPRWQPKSQTGPITPASEMALINAVSTKNQKLVVQLLDRGVSPNQGPDSSLLIQAVRNHDFTILRYLLLYGADPNIKDHDEMTPLYAATQDGFFEAAQMLVEYNADPSVSAGATRENALAISLVEGKIHFAQLYLKYCADSDIIMGNGNTSLIRAMTETTPANVVELMLLYGANTNRKNSRGESALFKAINAGRLDLVTLLLDHGADPNLPAPKHMLWPSVHEPRILELILERGANLKRAPGVLELATSINSIDAVTLLLKYGADPNAKKDGIFTPLCTAIRDDRGTLVDILIAARADPNLPASEYPAFKCVTHHRAHLLPRILLAGADPNTPKGIIETAVAHQEEDALLLLLDQNVDVNARAPSGNTALTTAIRQNNIRFIDILLEHGADPGVRGQEWPIAMAVSNPAVLAKLLPHISTAKIIKGALEMAVVANQLESVKLLLAKGISVEEKNGGVFSPLTTSIREDRKEIFRYLIDEAGADPNSPGEHLPIIKAIRRHRENDLSYIEHLLGKGADINLMYRGWNAVLQAVDNGDVKILKLLAEVANPDLSAKDENGRTVYEIMDERDLKEEEAILLNTRPPSQDVVDATARLRNLIAI